MALPKELRKSDIEDIDANPYPDRLFAFFALILAIAAGVLSTLSILALPNRTNPVLPSWEVLVRDACIVFTMLILVLFFYGRYRIVLGAKLLMKTNLEQQLKAFRDLIGQQIEVYYHLMSQTRESIFYGAGDGMYPRRFLYQSDDLQKLLSDSLDNVISSLHEILTIHLKTKLPGLKEEIAFSIKAKVSGQIAKQLCSFGQQTIAAIDDTTEYVVTLARDQLARTRGGREVKQALYSINRNTAFRRVLKGGDAVFCSNNLQQMANYGEYDNETPKWRENYNATLVVPIWHRGGKGKEPLAFGLLTVDSKNIGRHELFDLQETKLIMSFGADLLALVFLNLELFDSLAAQKRAAAQVADPRRVFVAHGRNEKARNALFEFLRSLDLDPQEWSQLVGETGKGAPQVWEVLKTGFEQAQAFVVLMTPDDEAQLAADLRNSAESDFGYQPRPNVILEAGMALGIAENRTILVEVGKLRQITNMLGRLAVRMDNSPEKRTELAQRLQVSGCPVKTTGTSWLKAGDFDSQSGD